MAETSRQRVKVRVLRLPPERQLYAPTERARMRFRSTFETTSRLDLAKQLLRGNSTQRRSNRPQKGNLPQCAFIGSILTAAGFPELGLNC